MDLFLADGVRKKQMVKAWAWLLESFQVTQSIEKGGSSRSTPIDKGTTQSSSL